MTTHGPVKVERWKPDVADASAYLLANRVVFSGECLTTIGGITCGPYVSVDADISHTELGVTLMRVLAEARVRPVPTDLKAELQALLKTAGVRSWSKLTEADCCVISLQLGIITMIPTRAHRRAFLHLPERALRIPENAAAEQVGKSLRDAFRRCNQEQE